VTMPFSEPGEDFSGVRINPADAIGHLLLVWVIEYIAHSPTRHTRADKLSDVIVVDVVDLDVEDPGTGQPGFLARHSWWRQSKLIQSLRPRVGDPNPLLAYMGKGGANPGFNAPYVLTSATKEPAAVQRARDWMARNPGFQPSEPFNSVQQGATQKPMIQEQPTVDRPAPSLLERMALGGQQGADRLAHLRPPPQGGQGQIPF
jgi:hypothetical protein